MNPERPVDALAEGEIRVLDSITSPGQPGQPGIGFIAAETPNGWRAAWMMMPDNVGEGAQVVPAFPVSEELGRRVFPNLNAYPYDTTADNQERDAGVV